MSWISGNRYLSSIEQYNNVVELWEYMGARRYTRQAVAALAANMEAESTINPGIWENLTPTTTPDVSVGYGLCQWTPWNKYADWAGAGWQDNGNKQCDRIVYEANNGIQWFENPLAPDIGLPYYPPITFAQFLHSTSAPEDLASMFLAYYEHPGNLSTNQQRRDNATRWYGFIQTLPAPTPVSRGKMPLWMMCKPYWKR